jgi:hypothetical protein
MGGDADKVGFLYVCPVVRCGHAGVDVCHFLLVFSRVR